MHNTLLESDHLKKTDDSFLAIKDILFSCPSAAAAVVMGRSANGLTEWKTAEGKILKSVEGS